MIKKEEQRSVSSKSLSDFSVLRVKSKAAKKFQKSLEEEELRERYRELEKAWKESADVIKRDILINSWKLDLAFWAKKFNWSTVR